MAGVLSYENKTVAITGAATGMGNETTKLLLDAGADVYAMDIADIPHNVTQKIKVDLGDKSSIDAAIADLPAKIDVLMNCAGIAGGTRFSKEQVMGVNFIGARYLTESLLPRIPKGGNVVNIASIAGGGWPNHVTELGELMAADSYEAGQAWLAGKDEVLGDGYFFSKEALQYYTMFRAAQLGKEGKRMNAVCPGVTDTQLIPDFREAEGEALDLPVTHGAGRMAHPREMAGGMMFLGCEDLASYINGLNLVIDGGFTAAMTTGQVDFG